MEIKADLFFFFFPMSLCFCSDIASALPVLHCKISELNKKRESLEHHRVRMLYGPTEDPHAVHDDGNRSTLNCFCSVQNIFFYIETSVLFSTVNS